jgi:hypothetical protein
LNQEQTMSFFGTSWNDPKTHAILGVADGLLSGNPGRGLSQGLLGATRQIEANEARDMRSQLVQRQLDKERNAQAEAQRIRSLLAENVDNPDFRALMAQGVPFETLEQFAKTKNLGREEVKQFERVINPQTGKPELAGLSKYGDTTFMGVQPAEKLTFQNGVALDPFTGQTRQVLDSMDPNDPFNRMGGQLVPNTMYQNYKMRQASAGAPRTTVQNINQQETEQSKVYGKGLGEMRTEINRAGFVAPSQIAKLDRMEQLLAGVEGGKLSPLGLELASAAKSFGLNIDPKLGNKEAAQALAIEMATSMRQPGTGAFTDKDFDNFMAAVPGLSKTAEGRAQITATLRAKAKRDMQAAQMAREYAKQNNGVIDDAFFDQLGQFVADNPVIPQAPQGGNGGLTIRRVR